jgi:hypothetical protein
MTLSINGWSLSNGTTIPYTSGGYYNATVDTYLNTSICLVLAGDVNATTSVQITTASGSNVFVYGYCVSRIITGIPVNFTLSYNGVTYGTYMTNSASSSFANVSIGAADFAAMVRDELCRKNALISTFNSGHRLLPTPP